MEHPLFPGKDGEDPPDIDSIHIVRQSSTGPIYAPHLYLPNEVESYEQIFEWFGGGNYILKARKNGRLCAEIRFALDGPSRPLVPPQSAKDQTTTPVVMAAPSAHTSSADALMLGLLQMFQQSSQHNATAMLEASRANTNLMMAMLARSDSQQSSMVATLTEASNRAQQSQAEFFKHFAEMGKSSNGGSIDAFKEGMNLGTTITEIVKGGDDSGDDLSNTLGTLIQSFAGTQQAMPTPQNQGPSPGFLPVGGSPSAPQVH